MRICIVGTRGIPNRYGGFEQFAEYFSTLMAERGHNVTVYASHKHTYRAKNYRGVEIIHRFDPESYIGTAGQFIYDFNCILDSRKRSFDIILQLGYTSSTIWSWLYPKKSMLVTNMDGLEWMRQKYNPLTRYFLTFAEKWAVKNSHYLIADSAGIQRYLQKKFNANSYYVAYGANVYNADPESDKMLSGYKISAQHYDLVIARFEPENNIETILRAYKDRPENALVLVGNYQNTSFGRMLFYKFSKQKNIFFAGAIFDIDKLNILRYNSRLYIHGHSVGGTNPSLLEAMACGALICAHDNIFNRNVLGSDAFYFKNSEDIVELLSGNIKKSLFTNQIEHNKNKIKEIYNWDKITSQLETLFIKWQDENRN